jgi:intracellular sulfur oxidation DsrE/DsrF family protein
MIKKLILTMIVAVSLFAKMEFSEPKPSFENPRKWLIKLNTNDIDKVNHTLDAINNVLKVYPDTTLNIVVIAYAKGMRVLKKDYDKKTLQRVRSVMEYGVEFIGCINTMDSMGWKKKEFINDISYVRAGIAQVLEKVAGGWTDVTPY